MYLNCKCLKCGHTSQALEDSIFSGRVTLTCPNCGNRDFPKIQCPECGGVSRPSPVLFNSLKIKCSKWGCGHKGYPYEFTVVIK